jgi:hypothetical protein
MFLSEIAMQRLDVFDVLLVCFAGDVEKWVAIRLDGLNSTSFTKKDVVTFTAYTRPLIAPIPV